MSRQIIPANYKHKRILHSTDKDQLRVSEFFCDTIQGEGLTTGMPAVFLRLQGCPLNCQWCDTREVWQQGNAYEFQDLFALMEQSDVIPLLLEKKHHLVITGGSPLMQQRQLNGFLDEFSRRYNEIPFIEIENECVYTPMQGLLDKVDIWNNSPKLSNSGVPRAKRYKVPAISVVSKELLSIFKFVVNDETDWEEIQMDFLDPGHIQKEQIYLMSEGQTRKEIIANAPKVVDMCVRYGVNYSPREHIILWDKMTGI